MFATIDIETTGLNRYKDDITFIGIGLSKSLEDEKFFKGYILDMSIKENITKFKKICKKLKELKATLIFQNGNFDTLFIEWKYGIKLPVSEDIMLMGTAYDLAAEHGLKKMAHNYLGVPDWDISDSEKTLRPKKKSKNFTEADVQKDIEAKKKKLIPYLKKDVKYTWQLFQFFKESMEPQQIKIYKKLWIN